MTYSSRRIRRPRRTKAEIQAICDAIGDVLAADHPQSVRHVFYKLVSLGLVPKQEKRGYETVQHQLLEMRRAGRIPWSWVSDGTRWRRQAQTFDSASEAVRWVAETYRRDLWRRTRVYVEVWTESDSMAGVLVEETELYGISLMTSRGFSSASYLYAAAQEIKEQNRPAYLYYVGDHDPSGVIIDRDIERKLRAFAPEADIHFERLLVTPEQIEAWSLPTKPAKKNSHAKGFIGGTVEAEAIPANVTRAIIREAIEQHLDPDEVGVIEVAEQSEAEWLRSVADVMAKAEARS